ncbi:MAG: hypothetical protein ABII27_07225 [bacterium]
MIIHFSSDQEKNIERKHTDMNGHEIIVKKKMLLHNYSKILNKYLTSMNLINILNEIVIDIVPGHKECFFLSSNYKLARVYYDDIDNGRDFDQVMVHQLGHIQDVLVRGFDLKGFREIKRIDFNLGYILWDIHLDGRLVKERYFTYFQEQSLYYEHKMKFRILENKVKENIDVLFDSMWAKNDYNLADVKSIFCRLN